VRTPAARDDDSAAATAAARKKRALTSPSSSRSLVVLATRVRHASANERYVRSYLESLGLDAYELDVLAQTRPSAFRLSVAREIEPVVQALRSMGLTGSALAAVVARAPGVLARTPEAHALPLCAALRALLGSNGVGALVRYPPLAELDVEALEAAARALSGPGGDRRAVAAFLWARPAAFERLARALPPPAGGAGLFGLYSAHRRRAGESDAALEALRAATARAAAAAGGGGAAEADAFADVERALEALEALDGDAGGGASATR
jgi:hypothetical protein